MQTAGRAFIRYYYVWLFLLVNVVVVIVSSFLTRTAVATIILHTTKMITKTRSTVRGGARTNAPTAVVAVRPAPLLVQEAKTRRTCAG